MRTTCRAFVGLFLLLAMIMLAAGCGEEPVAKLNGKPITQAEFMDALEQGLGLKEGPSTGKIVLSTMLVQRLVEEDAREKSVSVTEEEIDKEMAASRERLEAESGATFEEVLADMGTTLEEAREQMRFNLLLKKLTVTQTEVEQYFEQRPAEFDKPEMITFYQMFLSTEQAAQQVRKEVLEEKRSFVEVAKEKSLQAEPGSYPFPPAGIPITTSAESLTPQAHFIKEIKEVISSLEPGDLSQPLYAEPEIPSRQRNVPGKKQPVWVLFYLESRQPEMKATFENSKEEVERRVFSRKIASGEVRQYFDSLKAKARLEILDPTYSALGEEFKKLAQEMPEFTPPEPHSSGEGPAPSGEGAEDSHAGHNH